MKIEDAVKIITKVNDGIKEGDKKGLITVERCLDERFETAVKALELMSLLKDRPCDACKYHGENGCSKWNCVFDEKPDDSEEMAIQFAKGYSEGFAKAKEVYGTGVNE